MIGFRLHDGDFAPNARNFAQAGAADAPLLLFLPATRAIPRDYQLFLTLAASLGFSVLALDYVNRGLSLVKLCGGIPECYAAVQQNRFDGSAPNDWSAVSPQNSIVTRLVAALSQLHDLEPDGGWGRYLSAGAPAWGRIVVAGHSQGGGQAAFISKQHPLLGALMFSAPAQTDAGVSAPWLADDGATSPSRMFGFLSSNDVYFQNVIASWRALRLGEAVDVAAGPAHGRALYSTLTLGTPGEAHRRSVNDSSPLDDRGVPVFEPIWRYMLDGVWRREDS